MTFKSLIAFHCSCGAAISLSFEAQVSPVDGQVALDALTSAAERCGWGMSESPRCTRCNAPPATATTET